MFGFPKITSGEDPEPPPDNVAKLGLAPGFTVQEFPDRMALSQWARNVGVQAPDQWNAQQFCGAVDMKNKVVGMISRDATRDDDLYNKRLAHEQAHAWGLVHDDQGHGWYPLPGAATNIMNASLQQMAQQAQQNAAAQQPQAQATNQQQTQPGVGGLYQLGQQGAPGT